MLEPVLYSWISLDGPALLTVTACALTCALLGNFLVVRKMTMMGDALSHTVLPGIVLAFLLTGSRSSLPVILGAIAAGIITSLLVELITRHGDVEHGAAMGVVFVMFFALGVLLIEQAAARSVDLDADCILHGQLESIFWNPPKTWTEFWSFRTLAMLPPELVASILVLLAVLGFQLLLGKELLLSSFDPALSDALGFSSSRLHHLLMALVAAAAVVSFSSVGSIVVIAMLVCPAAAARLLTDRFATQVRLSLIFAAVASIGGYLGGAHLPIWLGFEHSLNAAGAIGTACGLLLFGTVICAPRYGVAGKLFRDGLFSIRVQREDLLAALYRAEEATALAQAGAGKHVQKSDALQLTESSELLAVLSRRAAMRRGEVTGRSGELRLTESGREVAREIVRSHRLWENFFVESVGVRADHVHVRATELEHFTSGELAENLASEQNYPSLDPHGSRIPQPSAQTKGTTSIQSQSTNSESLKPKKSK